MGLQEIAITVAFIQNMPKYVIGDCQGIEDCGMLGEMVGMLQLGLTIVDGSMGSVGLPMSLENPLIGVDTEFSCR